MPQVWLTSDSHFHHKNILHLAQRPFESIEDMNEQFIFNWNDKVQRNDIVYHLGDFVFGGTTKWEDIISRLNGCIHLVLGNHDDQKVVKRLSHYFESVENMIVKKIDKQHLFLFHYPIEIGLTPNAYSIHGHIHERPSRLVNQINVGVDSDFIREKVGFGSLIPEEMILDELKIRKEMVLELRASGREEV
ncbi:Calcineurin-like phosphoesterase superfamily protein [Paenibacillus sophorae]|uniref:Calcineurin-like phosphoesterase superfamily protein n=1 Tax=Paenibacillus sophorae TaxID=1333845 RepID=A0A1H8GEP8_9BACL|nr:metallophosphoesterase [Paenibacillus sophorae]QWU14200.1 metallophosphoesterase [Paenibacillus sophorae]SEN42516.1 Calcineurin-like phosphoesterase superfamily protein [Paenibacillus sophorae]